MSDLQLQQIRRKLGLEKYPAILGDANGVVEDDPVRRPGLIRVRYATAAGLSLPPIVSIGAYQGSMKPGTSVWVGWQDEQLCLLRPHVAAQVAAGQNPAYNNGADERLKTQNASADIYAFKSHPTSSPSAYVVVRSLLYLNGTTAVLFDASEDDGLGGLKGKIDLTSYLSTAGNHRLICLFLKKSDNTIEVKASTAKSMLDPLGLTDLQECLTAASANVKPCWAWKSADAKATFDDSDSWLDLRQIVNDSDYPFVLRPGTALTIASGAVTLVGNHHTLTSESGTSDDLATLNGGNTGQIVVLQATAAHTITVKHGTGNIYLNGAADFALAGDKSLLLFYDGTNWSDLGAGGGATTALDNLASVAINTSLISDTDVTDDLGSAAKRWKTGYIQTLASDSSVMCAKNTSGTTANATECGYLDAAGEYKTTTTANYDGAWCAVLVGGANNADIYVARRGRVTIKLTGNCSAGNYLATSTTAGQAAVLTTMRPEVFAIALTANAGGAGGTCEALLYTGTRFIPATNANDLYSVLAHSTTAFTATINGAPSATSVVYNAPLTGSDDVLVPNGTLLLKARLWNTTRNSYRLISAVNTGTKTITTVSSTDSWASGDSITIESQTAQTGQSFKCIDLDMAQSVQTAVPPMARAINIEVVGSDSGTINATFSHLVHPLLAYSAARLVGCAPMVANIANVLIGPIPVIDACFTWLAICAGTATGNTWLRLEGYWEAIP